jgi:hypothetical protein
LSLLFEADLFADCFRQFFQNAFVPDKHSFDRVQVLLYSFTSDRAAYALQLTPERQKRGLKPATTLGEPF